MTWRFVASQDLTDRFSLDEEITDLGIAVWRVQHPNPGDEEEPPAEVKVYELDLDADGEGDRGGNDELATLSFSLSEEGEQEVERTHQRGSRSDPSLKLYFLLDQGLP